KMCFVKADRCGFDRLVQDLTHHRNDSGRIESAGEKCSQRYFTHQPNLYGSSEFLEELFPPILFGAPRSVVGMKIPILDFFHSFRTDPQIMSRPDLPNRAIN